MVTDSGGKIMSSLTEVDTGTLVLLFLAWQVRMESTSDLTRLVKLNRFSTLNCDT